MAWHRLALLSPGWGDLGCFSPPPWLDSWAKVDPPLGLCQRAKLVPGLLPDPGAGRWGVGWGSGGG